MANKRRWLTQPPYPVDLDDNNPITSDLVVAPHFNGSRYGAGQRSYFTVDGTGIVQTDAPYVAGLGYNFTNGASTPRLTIKTGPILGGQTNLTIMAQYSYSTAARAGGYALYSERGSSGNDLLKLVVNAAGQGNAGLVYRNDAGTLLQHFNNSYSLAAGVACTLAAVKVGTGWTTYFWCNAPAAAMPHIATDTFGSGSDAFTDASVESWIGNDKGDLSSIFPQTIGWVYGWKRALARSEIEAVFEYPFQVYRRRTPHLYSFPVAALTSANRSRTVRQAVNRASTY